MFDGITDISAFILGTIFIVLLPGPNSLYVLSAASRHGIAAGYRGAWGIFVGDTTLMLLATTGAASLLHAIPTLFMGLRYAGALYLSWLGIALLRAAWTRWRKHGLAEETACPAPSALSSSPFRTAFIISVLNPKAILFFVSFFIQFVSPDSAHPVRDFIILGVIVQFFSMLYLSILILGGARLAAQFRQRHWLAITATGGVGGLFICFGLRLANASLG
ncbi:MAG: leucine efflux protein LeuE [Azoarcus sp.]|jgi:leucine efflux protein|nr:leucine efflux protein LeuE [Azoarcus sp.]